MSSRKSIKSVQPDSEVDSPPVTRRRSRSPARGRKLKSKGASASPSPSRKRSKSPSRPRTKSKSPSRSKTSSKSKSPARDRSKSPSRRKPTQPKPLPREDDDEEEEEEIVVKKSVVMRSSSITTESNTAQTPATPTTSDTVPIEDAVDIDSGEVPPAEFDDGGFVLWSKAAVVYISGIVFSLFAYGYALFVFVGWLGWLLNVHTRYPIFASMTFGWQPLSFNATRSGPDGMVDRDDSLPVHGSENRALLALPGMDYLKLFPADVDGGAMAQTALWSTLHFNILILLFFTAQHTVMARTFFKKSICQILPPAVERSVYVFVSAVFQHYMIVNWKPMPQVIGWNLQQYGVHIDCLFLMCFFAFMWVTFVVGHLDFFGVARAFGWKNKAGRPPRYVTSLSLVLMFWLTPALTVGRLVLAVWFTVYAYLGHQLKQHLDEEPFTGRAHKPKVE